MSIRKTATIDLYHAYGTGKMTVSISYRGKVQKIIEHDGQSFSLVYIAKMWAAANGFTRAVVV